MNSLFEITRFSSFIEAMVENPEYRLSLKRPLEALLEVDKIPLDVDAWLQFWEELEDHKEKIQKSYWKAMSEFTQEEMQVMLRWLLDRIVREFGVAAPPKNVEDALELLLIVLHELARNNNSDILIPLVEQYLPLAQNPTMSSDLYQWLFSFTFNPDVLDMQSYLLALQGLEKAKLSEDPERIGWSAYNLITYHSFHDIEDAEDLLEEYLEFIPEDRYYDLLGNIALKIMEEDPSERSKALLENVWHYTLRSATLDGGLSELRSIGFNLAYYGLNLAWSYYDDHQYSRSLKVLAKLKRIMNSEKRGFMEAAKDLGPLPVDWSFQYYSNLAEVYLWTYACYEEMGEEAKAHEALVDFQNFRLACTYDLGPLLHDFFQEREPPEDFSAS